MPKESVLDRFIDTLRVYKKIRLGVATKCWIHNEGTAKANDITVTIKVPKGLLLLEFEDVDGMKEPKAPKLPKNPIQAAYEKSFYVPTSDWQKLFDTTPLSVIPDISALQNYRPIMSMGNNIKIENNSAEISIKSILHTQKDYMQGCYFVAVELGVYEVEYRIMCAECLEPDIPHIKIYADGKI